MAGSGEVAGFAPLGVALLLEVDRLQADSIALAPPAAASRKNARRSSRARRFHSVESKNLSSKFMRSPKNRILFPHVTNPAVVAEDKRCAWFCEGPEHRRLSASRKGEGSFL